MKRRADYIMELARGSSKREEENQDTLKNLERDADLVENFQDTPRCLERDSELVDGFSKANYESEKENISLNFSVNYQDQVTTNKDDTLQKDNKESKPPSSPDFIENSQDISKYFITAECLSSTIRSRITKISAQNEDMGNTQDKNLRSRSSSSSSSSSSTSSKSSSSSNSGSFSSSSSSSSSSTTTSISPVVDDTNQIDNNNILPSTSAGQVSTPSKVKDTTTNSQRKNRLPNAKTSNYEISPINSGESDADLSDSDPTYNPKEKNGSNITIPSTSSSSNSSPSVLETESRKSRKRMRDPSKWKQNVCKALRNKGKAYVSVAKSKKAVAARSVKEACRCRLKCAENINDEVRLAIFNSYWNLGDIELQRCYLASCMIEVQAKYRYTNAKKPRMLNHALYFTVDGKKIRVCKKFYLNTLDISDRQLRTIKKKRDGKGFIEKDQRGRKTEHKGRDENLVQDIKDHINGIPRIESHYLRAATSREYISGEKTIADLCRDFNTSQTEQGKPIAEYWLYYEVFNKDFNLGFFQPKKDRCDTCLEYELSSPQQKLELKPKYDGHLAEKDLCREEKRKDRQNIDGTNICAVYDLQAVLQCPTGESSAFFYKSKLNCFNFTIAELAKKSEEKSNKRKTKNTNKNSDELGAYGDVFSYFWDETKGRRGANEIGSCLWDYLSQLSAKYPNKNLNVTFYSDNCCGQNKNKFITCLYSLAVSHFENINSITHKYLIKGHTQNEGDNVHSLIEKEIKKSLKGGPIYAPHEYVSLIKQARKTGTPFKVKELDFDFFYDLKTLQEKWGYNFNEDQDKNSVSWNDIKVLKFLKEQPFVFHYKTSFAQTQFSVVDMRNKRKKMSCVQEILLVKAFNQRLELSENKKKDLKYLLTKNLIPGYSAAFYNTIL